MGNSNIKNQEYAYFKKQEMIKREKTYQQNFEKNFGYAAEYEKRQREMEKKDKTYERKRKLERAKQIRDGIIFGLISLMIGVGSTVYAHGDKIIKTIKGPEVEPTPIERIMEETGKTSEEVFDELGVIDQRRMDSGVIDERPYEERLRDYAENYDSYADEYIDKGARSQ